MGTAFGLGLGGAVEQIQTNRQSALESRKIDIQSRALDIQAHGQQQEHDLKTKEGIGAAIRDMQSDLDTTITNAVEQMKTAPDPQKVAAAYAPVVERIQKTLDNLGAAGGVPVTDNVAKFSAISRGQPTPGEQGQAKGITGASEAISKTQGIAQGLNAPVSDVAQAQGLLPDTGQGTSEFERLIADFPEDQQQLMKQQRAKLLATEDMPMTVKEWEYYSQLSTKKAKDEYLTMKRANQLVDIGARIVSPSPTNPTELRPVAEKGLPPQEEPAHVKEKAMAQGSGEAEATREAEKSQAKLRVNIISDTMSRLKQSTSELLADPGIASITGVLQGRLPAITQGQANALAKYNNISSQIFINALQAMREASKTGGAVGNVSDKEGDRLEQAWVALERTQDEKSFRGHLQKLIAVADLAASRVQQAYADSYGEAGAIQNDTSGGTGILDYD